MEKLLGNKAEWNDILDIDEIAPGLNQSDKDCLEEIRQILLKHNKTDKFGVNLLHKHFEINDNEILMEVQDLKQRTLTTRPMTQSELEIMGIRDYRPTSWKFDSLSVTSFGMCATGMYGQHYGYRD